MKTKLFRWSLIPTLALAVFAACSDQPMPTEVGLAPSETTVESKSLEQDMWRIANGLPIEHAGHNSAVIGPNGGILYVDLHYLYVPRGAVTSPTQFDMYVDSTGAVAARLEATSLDASGAPVADRNNVGRAGFKVPVYLTFSYAHAYGIQNAHLLKVLWARPDGKLEAQPTVVNERYKAATGVLKHFSIYTLGWGG